jgi:hypothetical protein
MSIAFAYMFPGTAISQATPQSAEIKRLDFYVGRWSETGQMRDNPTKSFAPISGGETCRWAASGSAVLCQEKEFVGDFGERAHPLGGVPYRRPELEY